MSQKRLFESNNGTATAYAKQTMELQRHCRFNLVTSSPSLLQAALDRRKHRRRTGDSVNL